jgi:hypothetical protein
MLGAGKIMKKIPAAETKTLAGKTWTLLRAIYFASRVYKGITDKAGEPILWHALRVGISLLPDADAAIVGVLHEVLKDTTATHEELLEILDGDTELYQEICALTRFERTGSYEAYIERVRLCPGAIAVKLADLEDNLNLERQARALAHGADPARMTVLRKRYNAARRRLLDRVPTSK